MHYMSTFTEAQSGQKRGKQKQNSQTIESHRQVYIVK